MSWGRHKGDDPAAVPPCPTGCGRVPDPRMFVCNGCWELLTPQRRRQVYDAWTQARDGIDGGVEYFARVKTEAIEAAKVQLLRPPGIGAPT